ncbi:hypothetical protein JR316_0000286 [Psilocybe cubensis]|uniref:Uncharacterized protein n=2 Tax=Psilocybe cubensis TaxID=181762 RepID=A0ACB8HEX9_PSICU|nr:hypothetical protein JR316_0000286 [Psilocybe cubensis]KAH9486222.1 hypothetical protein JR316_0000286 [Psilocybe cubensis]
MMSSLPIVLSDVNQRVRKNAKVDPKNKKPLNEVPFYNYLNFCREASKRYDVFFMALEAFVDEASRTGNWGEHKYPDSDDEEESESIDGEHKVMLAIPDNLESDKFDRNGFPIRQVSPPQTPKKSFEKVKLFKNEADHRPSLGLLTPEQTPVRSRQTSSRSAEVSVKDIKKESSDLFGPSLTVVNTVLQGTQAHPASTSPRLKKRKAEDSDSEYSGFTCMPQCPPTPAASPVVKRKVVVKVESDDISETLIEEFNTVVS